MEKVQTRNRTLAKSWTLSIGKREKKTFHFRFEPMIYHPFLQMGGKINKDQRVQKPFNVNLTIPKTRRHSEKPWFSKLTSEEIILDFRTRFNI